MKKILFLPVTLLIVLLSIQPSAQAKWGTFTMTDDNGDQVVVKHGLFGKKTIVKDRYGDNVQNSKSIFGLTKDTQVGVLGTEVHTHKGLFGFGKTEGKDVLGDTFTSNKNLLYKNTNVNLSGANSFLNKFFPSQNQTPPLAHPNIPGVSGQTVSGPADPMPNMTSNSPLTPFSDPNLYPQRIMPNSQNLSN